MISLIISMKTNAGKALQSKLTYLNETASDADLWELGTRLANLTSNTFVTMNKMSYQPVDPSSLKRIGKSTVPITILKNEGIQEYAQGNEATATEILLAAENQKNYFILETPFSPAFEDAFYARVISENGDKLYNLAIETNGSRHTIFIRPKNEIDAASNGDATIKAFFPETDRFYATEFDFEIKGE